MTNLVEKMIKLYEQCPSIADLNCNTIDYYIFKENPDIHFCNMQDKNLFKYVPLGSDKLVESFHGFIGENPYFWFIPLKTLKGTIFGFVLKSYDKKAYRNFFTENHISCFYGWNNFKAFKKNVPLILTEGIKDCIVTQRIYPNTLACLTDGLSGVDDVEIISNLTNRVILLYDNDKAGVAAKKRDLERLSKKGIACSMAFYNSKDPGELYNNPVGFNILQNSLKQILQSFV